MRMLIWTAKPYNVQYLIHLLTSLVLQIDAKVIPQAFPGIAFQGSSP